MLIFKALTLGVHDAHQNTM